MSLLRKTIRNYVAELIEAQVNPPTGHSFNIVPSLDIPRNEDALSAGEITIGIHADSETISSDTESPRTYQRELTLDIELIAASDSSVDDLLDGVADDIECAIGVAPRLRGQAAKDEAGGDVLAAVADDCVLRSIRFNLDESGNVPLAWLTIEYVVKYQSQCDGYIIEPGDFKKVVATWKTTDGAEAEDEIDPT